MCQECGCGLATPTVPPGHPDGLHASSSSPAPSPTDGHAHSLPHSHAHSHQLSPAHSHPHAHDHGEAHGTGDAPAVALSGPDGRRLIEVQRSLLERNQQLAERNRRRFQEHRILALNMVSSPGSGKTTLVEQTARRLHGRLRTGVIVGDLATENDANRLRAAGIPVVPITTGTLCHLEAGLVDQAMNALPLGELDLVVIENVGNLVCPAAYDLGEAIRVVLLSVTEGEDKPLKYPPLFHSAHAAVITKTDLAAAVEFQRATALEHLHRISHHAEIFEVSARTGGGLDAWCEFLLRRRHELYP